MLLWGAPGVIHAVMWVYNPYSLEEPTTWYFCKLRLLSNGFCRKETITILEAKSFPEKIRDWSRVPCFDLCSCDETQVQNCFHFGIAGFLFIIADFLAPVDQKVQSFNSNGSGEWLWQSICFSLKLHKPAVHHLHFSQYFYLPSFHKTAP